ncbi:MAG: DNA repair protein RecN [Betaproteobacteria bacterium]|nr:DNA repair protein RecN [Betaproteobacteria bacterium]
MLRQLAIRDFVIVEALELEFQPGFTVLTGETGAGKSILVDALELAAGGRTDASVIRNGAERAEISAEFDVPERGPLAAWLEERELGGDPGALLLRRTFDRAGRGRAFVNGHSATVAQLREAGEFLIDIHGQHAHQSLLRGAAQRALLDAHAGLEPLAKEVAEAYRVWRRLGQLASEAEAQFAQREAERADLEERVRELARLAPADGEWDSLASAHSRLAHGAGLLAGAQASLEELSEADGASLARLSAAAHRLRELSAHDPGLAPIVELLAGAQAQAGEAVRELRHYASRIELEPEALHAVESRIEALHAAARKHRVRPADLAQLARDLAARLAEIQLAGDPEALRAQLEAAKVRYDSSAAVLSEKRRAAAQALGKAVSAKMQQLAMAGGKFAVVLEASEERASFGRENVEFQVASHPSLPLRPLAKVASGGELSRISLAVHMVAAKSSPVGTLIFDEVDSGIGGAVAEVVGRALRSLGTERQVLCVTHLPQVAAQGDVQWSVTRSEGTKKGARVSTGVTPLDRAARIEEVARMLGGTQITATTRKHAEELLGK